jgi:hypothetical protein
MLRCWFRRQANRVVHNNNSNNNTIRLVGSDAWKSASGKLLAADQVTIAQMGDLHPRFPSPIVQAKTIVFHDCDKNFIFYWMKSENFPHCTDILLASHPCDPDVFSRFCALRHPDVWSDAAPPTIWMRSHYFDRYRQRWAPDQQNVKKMTAEQEEQMAAADRRAADDPPIVDWHKWLND